MSLFLSYSVASTIPIIYVFMAGGDSRLLRLFARYATKYVHTDVLIVAIRYNQRCSLTVEFRISISIAVISNIIHFSVSGSSGPQRSTCIYTVGVPNTAPMMPSHNRIIQTALVDEAAAKRNLSYTFLN